jgi:disulfide bond formation protein DsbB
MALSDTIVLLVVTNMTLIGQVNNLSLSRWYWLVLTIGSLSLISIALYFQYFREELPCTMCIQVRLWFTLLIIVSFIGLLLRKSRVINALAQLLVVAIAAGLVERSYQLLGTERGFVFASCGVDLGLPAWFAIEAWLPWLYRVETSCGYTPEVIFGITMAEALMVLSVFLLVVSFGVLLASLITVLRR